MTAATERRLRRLHVRAWRRGIKEMDLILGRFVDECGPVLDDGDLDGLEALMEESDIEIYAWVAGRASPPEAHAALIRRIARHAGLPQGSA